MATPRTFEQRAYTPLEPVHYLLQRDLDAFATEFNASLPPEQLEVMLSAEAYLAQQEVLAHALQEGDQAPDFTLPNVFGRQVTLYEELRQGPVVLSFFRGAWCPYCVMELKAYQRYIRHMRMAGLQLLGISPQHLDANLQTAECNSLVYPLLSDETLSVAKDYGVLFDVPPKLVELYKEMNCMLPSIHASGTWQLPVPATFMIRPDGVIHKAFTNLNFRIRLEPQAVMAAAPQPATP
jgi:peroxiredoxin